MCIGGYPVILTVPVEWCKKAARELVEPEQVSLSLVRMTAQFDPCCDSGLSGKAGYSGCFRR